MVDDDSPKHPLPQGIKHFETQELACLVTQWKVNRTTFSKPFNEKPKTYR